MGRTVKRVPLDFNAPLNKVWGGYLLPREFRFPNCPACNSTGSETGAGFNPQTAALARNFYANHLDYGSFEWRLARWCDRITQEEVAVLVEGDRLWSFTHTWEPSKGWQPKYPPFVPTADQVNEWQRTGFGHDGINRYILIEARAKRLGVWGFCQTCGGHGDIATDEQRAAKENWEPTEPPIGEGWQLWETVSEGSPQSPVFASAEELAGWCEINATLSGDDRVSKSDWLRLIRGDDGMDLDTGSLLIVSADYFGPAGLAPK